MHEDEDMFDAWSLQDEIDALAEMRAYLVQTAATCFAGVLLCEAMVVALGGAAAFVFTTIAVAAAIVALVQTAECSGEIIRLEQMVEQLVKAKGGA